MLDQATVTANIPAADLARAHAFYADTLGVTPAQEMEGVAMLYRTGGGSVFSIYQAEHAGRSGHTIAQWHVDDVATVAQELAAKGVRFEHFEAPGLEWDGDVAFTEGMGYAAWFRDSEDNVLCLDSGFPEQAGLRQRLTGVRTSTASCSITRSVSRSNDTG